MGSAKVPLVIDQGADFRFAAQWRDSDGEPKDLSGAVIVAHLRARYLSDQPGPALMPFTVDGDDEGWLHLSLTPAQTATLPPGDLLYDVRVTVGAGLLSETVRLLSGSATVTPQVSSDA